MSFQQNNIIKCLSLLLFLFGLFRYWCHVWHFTNHWIKSGFELFTLFTSSSGNVSYNVTLRTTRLCWSLSSFTSFVSSAMWLIQNWYSILMRVASLFVKRKIEIIDRNIKSISVAMVAFTRHWPVVRLRPLLLRN